ncbi:hypothetical protein BH20ACT13_BH20ACT13_10720 [soil metagenome]
MLVGASFTSGYTHLTVGGDTRSDADGLRADGIGSSLPPGLNSSAGKAIYVSTKGLDRNPGTLERPLRTIQRALDRARPGERILVRRGTYEENLRIERSGARAAPITLAGYRDERPVVRARPIAANTYAIVVSAFFIRIKGLVLEGATGISSANVYLDEDAGNVELRGNVIRKGQDQGVIADSETSNVQIIGNVIHSNGAGLPGQHQSHGIYSSGTGHVIVNNVVYDHPHGFGIHVYPKNEGTIVSGNTVVHNAQGGIVLAGELVKNITVRNNIFAYNGVYGISVEDETEASRVDSNLVYRNASSDIRVKGSGADLSGGNVTAPPRFANLRGRNLHLTRHSPAIDRAVIEYSKPFDVEGVERPQGRAPDIGAFEWTPK